jgi:Domain of unknown function (DUF4124)
MYKLAALLLALSLTGTPAVAELYKWIGADGKINYSDTPPPADAKKVEKKRLNDRVAEGDGLDFATRNASKKYPVVLFVTDCGTPCDQARALLAKRGVPHTEKNPEKNRADGQELKKLIGALEVPDLQVGKDKPIKGFEEAAWNAALDAAGYPKSAAPLKANAAKATNESSKDAGAKRKTRSEEIGADSQAKPNSGGGGGGAGNANSGNSKDLSPSFTNKAADPNARSGPYHEPDLPPSATKNQPAPQAELTQQQIDEMEGIKR